jgi:hypothetical protein
LDLKKISVVFSFQGHFFSTSKKKKENKKNKLLWKDRTFKKEGRK